MAGSFVYQGSDLHASLDARIEGLKFLAHHLDEPVVIFNPQMELVYANPSAERLAGSCPLLYSAGKENPLSPHDQMEHCEPCPGKHVFEGIEPFSGITSLLPSSTTSQWGYLRVLPTGDQRILPLGAAVPSVKRVESHPEPHALPTAMIRP